MAGNISKYFYEVAVNKNCADFHHPGKTCVLAAIECFKSGLIGSAKFYFPLCFVSELMGGQINYEFIFLFFNVLLVAFASQIQTLE